jgi:hypothetical protein
MDWARMLAYVTGTVDQELLARLLWRQDRRSPSAPDWPIDGHMRATTYPFRFIVPTGC